MVCSSTHAPAYVSSDATMFGEGTTFQLEIDPVGRASISELRRVFFDDLDASSRVNFSRRTQEAGVPLPSWTPMASDSPITSSDYQHHDQLHDYWPRASQRTIRMNGTHPTTTLHAATKPTTATSSSSMQFVNCVARAPTFAATSPEERDKVPPKGPRFLETLCTQATSALVSCLGNTYYAYRSNKLPEAFVTMALCGINAVAGTLAGVMVKRLGGSFVTHTVVNLFILKFLCMCGYVSVQWGSLAKAIVGHAQYSARMIGGNADWYRRVQTCSQVFIDISLRNSFVQTAFGLSALVGIFVTQ